MPFKSFRRMLTISKLAIYLGDKWAIYRKRQVVGSELSHHNLYLIITNSNNNKWNKVDVLLYVCTHNLVDHSKSSFLDIAALKQSLTKLVSFCGIFLFGAGSKQIQTGFREVVAIRNTRLL